jgi:AraC family transcriptional regulator, ethanolamine operon transcriptional activator
MLFKHLHASTALSLEGYTDFDHFHESERYARAQSIPLSVKDFCVLRANLALPSCTLSLVRTFPRIINGYEVSNRLLAVIPMDDVATTRLNGKPVGQSIILIKRKANCTITEPNARLVAILSINAETLGPEWLEFGDGHWLLRLQAQQLANVQRLIRGALEVAATNPEAMAAPELPGTLQATLLRALDEAIRRGTFHDYIDGTALERYKSIIDQVDRLIGLNPLDADNERLAEEIGISVRTLQTASRSVCHLATHRYSRLRRLWSVRRQLRGGATGLTVKASALAHGFWHISQFTNAYRSSFGELPSVTLAQARFGRGYSVPLIPPPASSPEARTASAAA